MGLITKVKSFFASRYIKSTLRYVIAALIGSLATYSDLPGVDRIIGLLTDNSDKIADALTVILTGLLGGWSLVKNTANAKISRDTK